MNILSVISWMTDWVNLSGLEKERSILEQKNGDCLKMRSVRTFLMPKHKEINKTNKSSENTRNADFFLHGS